MWHVAARVFFFFLVVTKAGKKKKVGEKSFENMQSVCGAHDQSGHWYRVQVNVQVRRLVLFTSGMKQVYV